jgi:electron transport protein HydN
MKKSKVELKWKGPDMKKEKIKNIPDAKSAKGLSRREFLKDAGIVVGGAAVGSIALAGACTTTTTTTATQNVTTTVTLPAVTKQADTTTLPASTVTNTATTTTTVTPPATTVTKAAVIPISGYISWDATKCVSCGRCKAACAIVHEGGTTPVLSSIGWFENKWFDGWDGEVPAYPFLCQQCDAPDCYTQCPLKDSALCIDATTGARYVDKTKCTGCGMCAQVCPLDPPRVNIDPVQKKAIKCDLCRTRTGGPVCVYVCDRLALTLVTKDKRV